MAEHFDAGMRQALAGLRQAIDGLDMMNVSHVSLEQRVSELQESVTELQTLTLQQITDLRDLRREVGR
jgi:hypothetical protein